MNFTLLFFVVALTISEVFGRKIKQEIISPNIKSNENSNSEEYSDDEYSEEAHESPENEQVFTQERLVTSLQVIYGSQGVSVHYWYNETANADEIKSAPGCPKSIDGFPWVYYGTPPRCYLAGHHGPCGFRQKLLVKENSRDGFCACECVVDGIQEGNVKWDSRKGTRYISCQDVGIEPSSYGQVFDKLDKACYEPMTQGPCADGEVLVSSTSNSVECFPSCGFEQYRDGKNCYSLAQEEAGIDYVESHECSKSEKYSKILKRCVKKSLKFRFG